MLRKSFLRRVTKLASAGCNCLAKTLSVYAVRLADRFGCRVAGSASVSGLTRAQQEIRLQLATADSLVAASEVGLHKEPIV